MTADRARGALAVLQDADGKFICEVPCGYIVEQTASAHKPRRIQAQRRRRAMLRRRVALTVALLTVAALLAALMPWSGSGAADKPKDTTAGTLEEVHQPTAALLPSSGTVAEYCFFTFAGSAGGIAWTGTRRRDYYVSPEEMKNRWEYVL